MMLRSNRGFRVCVRFLAIVAGGFLVSPVHAQQYFDPGIMQRTIESKPDDYAPVGARVGSFMFWPGAELVYESNDNVFYDETDEIDDTIWHVRPWVNVASDWNRHSLNFSGWADFARYDDFGVLDYEDWALRLDGRFDVKRESFFSWEVSEMSLHEDRRSPDARQGLKVTEFDYGGYGFGYDHTFNKLTLGAYLRGNYFDYKNNVNLDGEVIDNQFRDRDETTFTFRADYLSRPGRTYFAAVGRAEIDYDITVDPNGFRRSSSSDFLRLGVNWDLTGKLNGELFGQWTDRDYDDPTFPSVDGFNLGAGLTWTPTQLTTVSLRLAGGPQETVQADAAGYFSRLYSVRVQHELRRNLLLNLRASYTDNDYESLPGAPPDSLRDTQITRAGAGLTYLLNRNFYVSGGYVYEDQSSNQARFEYRSNRWFLTLGIEL